MGVQIYQGLSTVPHALQEHHLFSAARFSLLGGAAERSARSQFRVPTTTRTKQSLSTLAGARVVSRPPALTGASQEAKNGEPRPPGKTTAERIRKRSYRRALKRAEKEGTTMYRGAVLSTTIDPSIYHWRPRPPSRKTRLQCFSWNCSGLSTEVMMELLAWLRSRKDISIIVIQETHWGFSNDWVQAFWHGEG